MPHFFTNAPATYDYSYVQTVKEYPITAPGQTFPWRKISVTDEIRFETYQKARYNSGLYTTIQPGDTEEVRFWIKRGLPEEALQP